MISESQNRALRALAVTFENLPDCADYRRYCLLREQGLRKPALAALDGFLKRAATWDETRMRRFIETLFAVFDGVPYADNGGFPTPLSRFLLPRLQAWRAAEGHEARLHYWCGKYTRDQDALRQALAVDPACERARTLLLNWQLDYLDYATHHLPDFYIRVGEGDEHDDYAFAQSLQAEIALLQNSDDRADLQRELAHYTALIAAYIDWKESGSGETFAEWGRRNGRHVHSGVAAYCYGESVKPD